MLAESIVVHTVLFEGVEARNLGYEVHDSVLAAHELTEPKLGVDGRQVFFSVCVSKGRRDALHGGAKDVNPARQCHVERSRPNLTSRIRHKSGQLELLDKADGGLEVLMPGDIQKTIIKATYDALKEDEAQCGF